MNRNIVGRHGLSPLVMLTIALSGCMSTKVDHGVDAKALQDVTIVKGTTTLKELTDQFGAPESVMDHGDGTRMISWSGVRGTAHTNMAGMFIPFAPVSTKYDAQSTSLQVTVNQKDIVVDYTRTSGDMRMLNMGQ